MICWWRTSIGNAEILKLTEAVSNEHISQGVVTEQLESEIAAALDVPYVVVTTSGSVALLMALMSLGVGRDDEVIVPNRTWIATAHAAMMVGAKVVLVDVRPDIPVMDIAQVKKKITNRTKAIIPVHLNGRAVEMKKIYALAKEHELHVVDDACQALFSRGADDCFLGTRSDAGCFSLGISKLISTGQGGFAVTRNRDTYEQMKLIRNHGVSGIFTETWNRLGFNFKFTDLLASVGLVQLTHVRDRIARLKTIYAKYKAVADELPFLSMVPVKTSGGEVPLYAEVLCAERDELREFLKSQKIETRVVPPDLSVSEYIENDGNFSNSKIFSGQGFYLPCGPEQPLENIDRVVEVLKSFGSRR